MIGHGVTGILRDAALALLDDLVEELVHASALDAQDVVVVFAQFQFEHRVALVEVMAPHQAGRLELGQYPIDRSQAHVFAALEQGLEDIFSAEMALTAVLKDIEDLDPWQGGLEAGFLEVLAFHWRVAIRTRGCWVIIRGPIIVVTSMQMRILLIILIALLGSACSIYQPDLQQGNVLEAEKVAKLNPGMTRRQVLFVLGTPMLKNPFERNRWDYVYLHIDREHEKREYHRLTLYFEGDTLARIDRSQFE